MFCDLMKPTDLCQHEAHNSNRVQFVEFNGAPSSRLYPDTMVGSRLKMSIKIY